MAAVVLRREILRAKLHEFGADTNVEAGRLIGINNGTVSRVLSGKAEPGNRFIAAVLAKFPVSFDELFEVVADETRRSAA